MREPTSPVIDTDSYLGYCIYGNKGWGKSATLERILETHQEAGWAIFDAHCNYDENLFWVIKKKRDYPSIWIHPKYCGIKVPREFRDLIFPVCDEVGFKEILKIAIESEPKKIICMICDTPVYDSNHLILTLSKFFQDIYYKKIPIDLDCDLCIGLREAVELASRFERAIKGEGGKGFQDTLTLFMKNARHARTSLVFDYQRWHSLFPSIRDIGDRIIIKHSNPDHGTPGEAVEKYRKYRFRKIEGVYKKGYIGRSEKYSQLGIVNRNFPHTANLKIDKAYFLWENYKKVYKTPLPKFYHKKPKDSITQSYFCKGLKFEIDEEVKREYVERMSKGSKNLTMVYVTKLASLINAIHDEGFKWAKIGEMTGWTPQGLNKFKTTYKDYFE